MTGQITLHGPPFKALANSGIILLQEGGPVGSANQLFQQLQY
jgi:hypothetical protein